MPAQKKNKYWQLRKKSNTKKFQSVKALQKAIDGYFEECDSRIIDVINKKTGEVTKATRPIPYTIEGLCEILECSRQTLLNYERESGYEDYFDTIKKAKLKIQKNKVERALVGESQPAMSIFDLKNNHHYKDKVEKEEENKPPKVEYDWSLLDSEEVSTLRRLLKKAEKINIVAE